MVQGHAVIIEAYMQPTNTNTNTNTHRHTHTGLQIWKVDTILYPCGVALDSERPAPNIYTVCPLEVQTAVIASCEHRWPERAMG